MSKKYLASSQRVPYEGHERAKILFVGEAPGGEEVGQGRPFVGQAGQLLRRYAARGDIACPPYRLANLCQYRPRGNKFQLLVGKPELEEGLDYLEQEIKAHKPNVVVALGGWPMWYLTGKCGTKNRKQIPGSGIQLYRGSRLPALDRFGNVKVFCTYHPSYVNRVWDVNPVFGLDLRHAAEDAHFPELRYPDYEEFIDPPKDQLRDLVEESFAARWNSLDIETFPGGKFSCVGWAYKKDGRYKGVCVTFQRMDLWDLTQQVWESSTPKILQYGTYDGPFMERFYSWQLGGFYDGVGWDTYVASANLLPDFPRGLDFLCSIYTRLPYYKTERKVWKQEGNMMKLWKYNIKDTVGTHIVAEEQMKGMLGLYGHEVAA